MPQPRLPSRALYVSLLLLPACTGLVAGPPVQTSATVAVPSDSAWARARRGFAAEVLTIDVADSIHGTLAGRRYPRVTAPDKALERCHVKLRLTLEPTTAGTALVWDSRWVAPAAMAATQPPVCEEEREEVLSRIQQTIAPAQ